MLAFQGDVYTGIENTAALFLNVDSPQQVCGRGEEGRLSGCLRAEERAGTGGSVPGRHPDLPVPEAGAGGPCRGQEAREALSSQWLWEGLVTSRWAGLRPLNPVPVPPLSGLAASPSVCLSERWVGRFLPGLRKGEGWGWLSGRVGDGEVGRGRAHRLGSSGRLPAPPPVAQLTVGARPPGRRPDRAPAAAPPPPGSPVVPSAPSGGSSFHRAGRRQARDPYGGGAGGSREDQRPTARSGLPARSRCPPWDRGVAATCC